MASEQVAAGAAENTQTEQYTVEYIKSNFFRVVHADGFWGTMSPVGDLHIDFWNVRTAIPRRVTNEVRPNGEVETIHAEYRCDFVHEVEVGVVMSIDAARSLRDWLNAQLADIDTPVTT